MKDICLSTKATDICSLYLIGIFHLIADQSEALRPISLATFFHRQVMGRGQTGDMENPSYGLVSTYEKIASQKASVLHFFFKLNLPQFIQSWCSVCVWALNNWICLMNVPLLGLSGSFQFPFWPLYLTKQKRISQ